MGALHTPGPWVAAPYEGFGPRTTVRQGDEKTGMRIASTFETTSPLNVDRNEANARLIAAAPELLEALKQLLVRWDYDHGDDLPPAVVAARAVVAKAEGKA